MILLREGFNTLYISSIMFRIVQFFNSGYPSILVRWVNDNARFHLSNLISQYITFGRDNRFSRP
ncbi:hypothetical protein THIOM_001829 [Candidatus Thiomargarita nelsonii]|uniref:Uncharacterized protein n=1 Tax=Candidatus Thiomargarita nelsonii TaxID=1003181 RepID=A0A176S3A4_9GAMM|nr:hypothetical protein THIOM_001829 [Candidatus Thiomargarita nelsonii]